jgi:hypothetical protein
MECTAKKLDLARKCNKYSYSLFSEIVKKKIPVHIDSESSAIRKEHRLDWLRNTYDV